MTIKVHQANRIAQRDAIRQQTETLQWIGSSIGAYDRRSSPKLLEEKKSLETDYYSEPARKHRELTTKELLKHRWNTEVQALTRKVYEGRWEDARGRVAEGWETARKYVKGE